MYVTTGYIRISGLVYTPFALYPRFWFIRRLSYILVLCSFCFIIRFVLYDIAKKMIFSIDMETF